MAKSETPPALRPRRLHRWTARTSCGRPSTRGASNPRRHPGEPHTKHDDDGPPHWYRRGLSGCRICLPRQACWRVALSSWCYAADGQAAASLALRHRYVRLRMLESRRPLRRCPRALATTCAGVAPPPTAGVKLQCRVVDRERSQFHRSERRGQRVGHLRRIEFFNPCLFAGAGLPCALIAAAPITFLPGMFAPVQKGVSRSRRRSRRAGVRNYPDVPRCVVGESRFRGIVQVGS